MGVALLPVVALLFSATAWGVVWYPLRLLEAAGLHGLWVSVISFTAALPVGFWLVRQASGAWRQHKGSLLLLAIAAGLCNAAFILAVIDGQVLRVLLLFYLSPLWAILFGFMLLGERVHRLSMLVMAAAMAGAIIMLWDPSVARPWPRSTADWLALVSGVAFALSNVLVRKLRQVEIPVKLVSAWGGCVGVALVWALLAGVEVTGATTAAYTGAIALGLLGFAVMTLALQYGVTHMPVQRSAIILLFELVAGALSAQWLAGELVTSREWLGGSLIVVAALLIARLPGQEP